MQLRAFFVLSVLVLLPVLALASGGGQAVNANPCGSLSSDCRSRTFQPTARSRAAFESCSSTRLGRIALDGDAGTLRVCQRDGGWGEIGGGSSGGDSFWVDGGTGTIQSVAPMRFSGDPALTAHAYAASSTVYESYPGGLLIDHPNSYPVGIAFLNGGNCPSGTCAQTQLGLWYSPGSGRYTPQDYFGNGLNVGTLKTTLPTYWLVGGRAVGVVRRDSTTEGIDVGLDVGTSDTAIRVITNGKRIDLGTGSTDHLVSDGTNVVTAGGLKVGGTTATAIASSYGGALAYTSASIAAHTCSVHDLTINGCNQGAECVTGAPTGQPANVITSCYVHDGNAIKFKLCNIGTVAASPPTGDYPARCLNR